MSRKLIYVSGLLGCYCCHLDYTPDQRKTLFSSRDGQKEIVEHMGTIFQKTPLEISADVLLQYPHLDEAARKILNSYGEFVGMLADEEKRDHLEKLIEEDAEDDQIYQRARDLSHVFREGLIDFFFDPESDLNILTKNYGVF